MKRAAEHAGDGYLRIVQRDDVSRREAERGTGEYGVAGQEIDGRAARPLRAGFARTPVGEHVDADETARLSR